MKEQLETNEVEEKVELSKEEKAMRDYVYLMKSVNRKERRKMQKQYKIPKHLIPKCTLKESEDFTEKFIK